MKKIAILIINLTLVAVICSAQPSKDSLRQKNIAADNHLLKALRTGDVTALDQIVAPDFFNHTGNHRGPDSLKSSISGFHTRMKPVNMDLIRQLADDEYVSDWVRYKFADPNIIIEGIEMTRYRDGKAVEHWFFSYNQPRPH
jgi:hypothetical protein